MEESNQPEDATSGGDATADVVLFGAEPTVSNRYAAWLDGAYDVHTATDIQTVLSVLDATDATVLLVDQTIPEVSADDVLAAIRDRGFDTRVGLFVETEPDFDVIERGFDDYCLVPTTREELLATVETIRSRDWYVEDVGTYRRLLARRSELEATHSPDELDGDEEYQDLNERIETYESHLDDAHEDLLDDAVFVSTLANLTGEGGRRSDGDAGPDPEASADSLVEDIDDADAAPDAVGEPKLATGERTGPDETTSESDDETTEATETREDRDA